MERPIYKHVREVVGGWENVEIRPLEDLGVVDKKAKFEAENRHIIDLTPICNAKNAVKVARPVTTCECGKKYRSKNKYRHELSVRHVNYMFGKVKLA